MLTVDRQPLQSFTRLSACKDQSSWSLENGRKKKKWSKWKRGGLHTHTHTQRRDSVKTGSHMNAWIQHTHTQKHTHWALDAPLSVWHWCCQANQGTHSLSHLLISVKPDSCDVAAFSVLSPDFLKVFYKSSARLKRSFILVVWPVFIVSAKRSEQSLAQADKKRFNKKTLWVFRLTKLQHECRFTRETQWSLEMNTVSNHPVQRW